MAPRWFQSYVLPGLVYQSVIIGGAYGSGAELREFFLAHGPVGGLLGMAVSTLVFSLVLAASYEFARRFRCFDYRAFFGRLIGPAWIVFEVLLVLFLMVAMSILGAASGKLVHDTFGLPEAVGTVGMMAAIGLLVFYGTSAVERFLTLWSFVLYGCYILFLGWNLAQFGPDIARNFADIEVGPGWLLSGIEYAGYNLSGVPVLLFVMHHIRSRRQALGAGLLGGPIAMIPGALFFIAMAGHYQTLAANADGTLPVTVLLNGLSGAGFFAILFPIVLLGTFIETGGAMIHGINERVARVYEKKGAALPRSMRPAIALGFLVTAIVAADAVGLVDLIAKGYGIITYGFLAIYVLPVLTIGIWKLTRGGEGEETP